MNGKILEFFDAFVGTGHADWRLIGGAVIHRSAVIDPSAVVSGGAVYEFKQGDKTGEVEAIRRAKEDWAPVGL